MNTGDHDLTDAKLLRKEAERKLQEKKKSLSETEQKPDIQKLLHELQVHQIELEMQNEELRQAYHATEIALKKYTMLYEFAPMGFFSLDSECSICELNFTAAEMLGEKRFSLINTNFKLFIADDSKLVFDKFFRQVFTREGKDSCEVMLGYDNNPLAFVYIEGVVIGDDNQCFLSVVDISAFKSLKK